MRKQRWTPCDLRSKIKTGEEPRLSRVLLRFSVFVGLRPALLAGGELTRDKVGELSELARTRLLMGIPQHGTQTREFIIDHGKVLLRRDGSITRAEAGRVYAALGL